MGVCYVTIAYGDGEAVFGEASMLLVSLLAYAPSPRDLLVVTDHPERFAWLSEDVRTHAVSRAQLNTWQGVRPFSMRVKLEVARAVAPGDRAIVLLDADTLATTDLSPFAEALGRGALFMHTREFELGSSRRRGNRALWQTLRGRTFAGWEFREDDAMWNSGVLAAGPRDVPLLAEALRVYDAMGAAGVRHFATEQLVEGLVLERTGRLREARPWFTHYWGNKGSYDAEIAARLADVKSRRLTPHEAAEALRARPIALPAEVRPGKIEKVRRWFRRYGDGSR